MAEKKTIVSRWPRREKLLEVFSRQGRRTVMFVETGRRLELSEQVVVSVEFPAEERVFRLRGKVVARRRSSGIPPLPPGVEVELPSGEERTVQMVLDHAEGKKVDFVDRKGRRMPASIVVTYRRDEDFTREFTEDISEGGTFIRTDRVLAVGTEVSCRLKPPGYLVGIKIDGRVAWTKEQGEPSGMGIEFIFTSDRQRKKVRELVQKFASAQARQVKEKMQEIRTTNRFR